MGLLGSPSSRGQQPAFASGVMTAPHIGPAVFKLVSIFGPLCPSPQPSEVGRCTLDTTSEAVVVVHVWFSVRAVLPPRGHFGPLTCCEGALASSEQD